MSGSLALECVSPVVPEQPPDSECADHASGPGFVRTCCPTGNQTLTMKIGNQSRTTTIERGSDDDVDIDEEE